MEAEGCCYLLLPTVVRYTAVNMDTIKCKSFLKEFESNVHLAKASSLWAHEGI